MPALPVGIADTGRAQDPPLRPVVVKIVDFGIAKLRESGAHTQTGTVLGTPAYMSFEQASGMRSDELDARSDIYSLGVVTYEMLTGRTPFHSDTPVGYLRMHMQEDPPPFRTVKPDLPALLQLESVVMKALTKDRDQRYSSMLEFAWGFAQAAAAVELRCKPMAGSRSEQGKLGPNRAGTISPFELEHTLLHEAMDAVYSVNFSPNGKFLASLGDDNTVILLDVDSGLLTRTLTGHAPGVQSVPFPGVQSVAFSPDGKFLASGGNDKTVQLWDVDSGALRQTLTGHADAIESIAFSPDGKLLASGGGDKTVKLWDAGSGALRQTLTGHAGGVQSVAFSPDGKCLASGGHDKTVKLWDVEAGAARQSLTGHAGAVLCVAFSPDGKLLASASWDETVKLWDVNTGAVRRTLTGHTRPVFSVVFSPGGKLLASGSWDKTVKLWDVGSGTLRQTLTGHEDTIDTVAFSPNGKLLASGSANGTIKIWRAAP